MTSQPDPAVPAASIVVVGAGPAGLMAAQACADAGMNVDVYDAMPSVGRKFLLAGKGGLNLTHAEAAAAFNQRYGSALPHLQSCLDAFGPKELREWALGLGIDTFVGSSGRVFPREMKAAPMLRAWMKRLREAGVTFHSRQGWTGWIEAGDAGRPGGSRRIRIQLAPKSRGGAIDADSVAMEPVAADAVIFALGGGSWPRLGSDGSWAPQLAALGVSVAPLAPANCGFDCGWSDHFSSRWAGAPVKSAAISLAGPCSGYGADQPEATPSTMLRGEFVVTATGVEGSLIYRLSAAARDRIAATASAVLHVDLLPDRSETWIRQALDRPRGSQSMANHLRRSLGITGVKAGLLRECLSADDRHGSDLLAASIKRLPLKLLAPRPLAESISTAGGVRFEALDERLMLHALPGVFCAGEMLDWETPTGGYLLTACFSTGRAAGRGAVDWLRAQASKLPACRAAAIEPPAT